MDIRTKLQGLKALGYGNVLKSLFYAFRRDRLDRRYLRPDRKGPPVAPGKFREVDTHNWGAEFHFKNAGLELRFLAPDLVRLTWEPGVRPVPYARANREWTVPEVEIGGGDKGWTFTTASLRVEVSPDGAVRYYSTKGKLLRRELPPTYAGQSWTQRAELRDEERIYGLGERTASLNLRPGSYRAWNMEPMGAYTVGDDPLYVSVPAFVGLHSLGSYLVYFENAFESWFDFDEMASATFRDGALRYYFAAGPPANALRRYAEVTGMPAMPPRWALGFHQARWSYENEREVRDLVASFREHELPLSAVHLDIHYMEGYRVFTVDRTRFPDLARLAAELKESGVRLVTIIDPGVKMDEKYELYADGLKKGVFCMLPTGEPAVGPVWPGNCVFPDFTSHETRQWWGEQYRKVADWGVEGVWHDMNEVAVFASHGEATLPLCTRHDFDGRGGDHREGHNLFALLEARAAYKGMLSVRPDKRPWILSRSGWAGLQRYAWTWSGDCESDWWTLRQSIRMALGMGLSGIPYNGPDIGGFGGSPSPELFIRWFQACAFFPFFRVHCAVFAPRREPWVFGEPTLSIVREFLKLRYRLMPYLYTLAWEAARSGHPLMRPMFWPDAAERALWDIDDQFFLGDALLVAPVLEPDGRGRNVVLPAGDWYDFWSPLRVHRGPSELAATASLERIPLYVRAGAVVPMDESGTATLHLYAPVRDQELPEAGVLYMDDGDGHGPARVDLFSVTRTGTELSISRRNRRNSQFPCPEYRLVLHGAEPVAATVDGRAADFEEGGLQLGPFADVSIRIR